MPSSNLTHERSDHGTTHAGRTPAHWRSVTAVTAICDWMCWLLPVETHSLSGGEQLAWSTAGHPMLATDWSDVALTKLSLLPMRST